MLTIPRDRETINRLQRLITNGFRARDELYAAAEALGPSDQSAICRWFADRLGGHVASLQQIVCASGGSPVGPGKVRPDPERITSIMSEHNAVGVLGVVEHTEHELTESYEQTMRQLQDREVVALLGQQRKDAEMADCVLRCLKEKI